MFKKYMKFNSIEYKFIIESVYNYVMLTKVIDNSTESYATSKTNICFITT